jgi:hypothetical protein
MDKSVAEHRALSQALATDIDAIKRKTVETLLAAEEGTLALIKSERATAKMSSKPN